MWGIRINPRAKIRPVIKPGKAWVTLNMAFYGPEKAAASFETKEEAESNITEKWEIAAELKGAK